MLNLRKFFVCLVLSIFIISSAVLATDINSNPVNDVANTPLISTQEAESVEDSTTATSIYEDLYIYNTDSYSLSDIVYGNIFASTNKFVTNPKNNGGVVSGNLYLISAETIIGSNVTYSNSQDKYGNYIVNSINSKTVINGNVYALSDTFTLQAGSEIHGDLYVAANKIVIEQDAVVDGNIFVTASEITLNGQVSGSAYVTSENFTMSYFTYISRDLYLNSQNANLAGIVYRNAFITATGNLATTADFRVTQNLSVDFANDFSFAGEVQGNAQINAKNLSFNTEEKCLIHGDLTYGTENEVQVPDGIVSGKIATSDYVDMSTNKFSLASAMYDFVTLLVFVFAIVFISRFFTKNSMEKLVKLNLKNILLSLAFGFLSLFIVFTILFVLLLSGVGIPLALLLVIGYLLVVGLALPVLLYNIANIIKLKLHIYVRLLIVTAVFYLISLIPVLGPLVVSAALLVGIGRLLFNLLSKKN